MKGLFRNQTVAVLASGPSLTQDDIDSISHLPHIAVNTTWEKARKCSVIFAGDNKWWIHNHDKIDIDARRISLSYNSERMYKAKRFKSKVAKKGGYNSGCIAIEYALSQEAERVIMLGFDCSVKNGIHHHGKHKESPNPNDGKCALWKKQFHNLRAAYPRAAIVNCSRYTELNMFPKVSLESALCGYG